MVLLRCSDSLLAFQCENCLKGTDAQQNMHGCREVWQQRRKPTLLNSIKLSSRKEHGPIIPLTVCVCPLCNVKGVYQSTCTEEVP